MADRTFASLIPRVAVSAHGCPQPTLIQYIRDAAIEVCERTLVWRYEPTVTQLVAGEYEYEYDTPAQAEVHAVLTATVNGERLQPVTLEQLYERYPDWPSTDPNKRATPRLICQLDSDHFVLAPLPDSAVTYELTMIVALKPLRTATSMGASALDEIETVVTHGALQNLLVLPNQAWSDRELAVYHAKQYVSKTTERRARANLGAARASLFVKMCPFG